MAHTLAWLVIGLFLLLVELVVADVKPFAVEYCSNIGLFFAAEVVGML